MADFEEDNIEHRQRPPSPPEDDAPHVESTQDYDMVSDADVSQEPKPPISDNFNSGPADSTAADFDFNEMDTILPSHPPFDPYISAQPPLHEEPHEDEPEPLPEVTHRKEPEPEPEPEEAAVLEEHGDKPASPVPATYSCSGGSPICVFLAKVYFHEKVQHVLLWRNIGLTVVALVLFLYTAFSVALLSFLSVIGYYGLAIIVCTFAIRLYRDILAAIGKQQGANFFILDLVDRAGEAEWTVSKDCVVSAVGKACDAYNAVADSVRDVILVRSYARTVKAVVGLYFLTWIGSMFNLLTLVILVVLNLFYIPLLLVKFDIVNNTEINAFVLRVRGYVHQGIDVVRQKAPFLVNFFESKVKTS